MTPLQILHEITERQLSDGTRLRRIVALFQRELGEVFGNARVTRRNRRYEIDVAVYEKPFQGTGRAWRMPDRQIADWVRQAAAKAHPHLTNRIRMDIQPWRQGGNTHKLFAPVRISVDARPAEPERQLAP